ncbi:MAG: C4-dicarboxylate ABC transporter permease [Ahrensia sp.]|nr:C4-dicarboxylate ABC transporter permease [Ahrensia sp.]
MARLLARLELAIGAVLLLVITGLVFAAAVMRFFGHPLIWSVDMAQLLLIWLCFFGATRAMRDRAHLGVDLVVRYFGRRIRLAIELGLAALFIVFMTVLAWEGYKLTMLNKERIFGDSGISYGFVTIAVPVGCILLSAVIIANAVQAMRDPQGRLLVFARPDGNAELHEEV